MLFILWAGCTDYKLESRPDVSDVVTAPAIVVAPDALEFPALPAGSGQELSFDVTNEGTADLEVTAVALEGSGAFTVTGPAAPYLLPPGVSETYVVHFTPANAEDLATIHVWSDDAGNPEVPVPVSGEGLYPALTVTPDPYDFGLVPSGCTATTTIHLLNTGLAPLTITSAVPVGTGYAASPTVPFPAVVAPGEALALSASYTPEPSAGGAELWVTSDDPRGTTLGTWTGAATGTAEQVDEFDQGTDIWDRADILVYVDQSGSMGDDQANLAANASLLVDALADAEMDWQLMVTNDDDGCHDGEILTSRSADPAGAFGTAVQSGGGSLTEAGLTIAYNAVSKTGSGACNDGFLRDESRTLLVLVSDEPEQSSRSWDVLVTDILALAPTTAVIAIVGDLPLGCDTAYPGAGYVEAAVATGGQFLSICSADWGDYFGTIATVSGTALQTTFPLTNVPDPTTIEVQVNGGATDEWRYDVNINAIVFYTNTMPDAGAHIVVSYRLLGDCEG